MSYGLRRSAGIIKPRSPLLDALIGYWELDEPEGNSFDYHDGQHLTAAAAPGQADGKLYKARTFNGSTQWLSRASEPRLEVGNSISYTVSCWCYPTTLQAQGMVCRWGGTTSEFALWESSSTRFTMNTSDGAVDANNFGNVQSSVWQLVIGWWNAETAELGIQVNDTAPNTTTTTHSGAGNSTFTIGAVAAESFPFAGRIDGVGLWKGRVLTAQERAMLYNNGNGMKYPFNPQ